MSGRIGARCVALMRSERAEEKLAGLVLVHRMVDVVQQRRRARRESDSDNDKHSGGPEHDNGRSRNGCDDEGEDAQKKKEEEEEGAGGEDADDDVDALKSVLLEAAYRAVGLKFLVRLMLPLKDRSAAVESQSERGAAPMLEVMNSGFPLSVAILKCIADDEALRCDMCARALSHPASGSGRDSASPGDDVTVLDVIEKVLSKLARLVVAVPDRLGDAARNSAEYCKVLPVEDRESMKSYFTTLHDVLEFVNAMLTPTRHDAGRRRGDSPGGGDADENASASFPWREPACAAPPPHGGNAAARVITEKMLRCNIVALVAFITKNVTHLAPTLMASGGYDMENKIERQSLSIIDQCVDAISADSARDRAHDNGGSDRTCGDTVIDDEAVAAMLEAGMICVGSENADVQLGALAVTVKVLRIADARALGAQSVLADHGLRARLLASCAYEGESAVTTAHEHRRVVMNTGCCVPLFQKGLRRFLSAKLDESRRHLLLEMVSVLTNMDNGDFLVFGKSNVKMRLSHVAGTCASDVDDDVDVDMHDVNGAGNAACEAIPGLRHCSSLLGRVEFTVTDCDDTDNDATSIQRPALPIFALLSHHLRVECEVMLHDAARLGRLDEDEDRSENRRARERVALRVLPCIFSLFERLTGMLAESQRSDDESDDELLDIGDHARAGGDKGMSRVHLDFPEDEMIAAFSALANVATAILNYIGAVVDGCSDDSLRTTDIMLLAAVRAMSRFACEAPDALLASKSSSSSSSSLLVLLPHCMGAGSGQGAAYLLPFLIQIAPNLTERVEKDDAGEGTSAAVRAVVMSALEHGLIGAVQTGTRVLCESSALAGFVYDARKSQEAIDAWSDVLTDLPALASAVPAKLKTIIQHAKEEALCAIEETISRPDDAQRVQAKALTTSLCNAIDLIEAFAYL